MSLYFSVCVFKKVLLEFFLRVTGVLAVLLEHRHYSSLFCETAFPLIPFYGDVTIVIPYFCAMECAPISHGICDVLVCNNVWVGGGTQRTTSTET